MDCSLREWWCLTLLVLFPLGPPSGWRAGMGRRLPVNIWTWAGSRAGVERSQGSQAGEVSAPSDTGLGRLSMCSPPPSQNKTMVKTRTDAREGGYCGHFRHLGQGPASNREACGSSSHESLELREGTGEPRTKKRGKAARAGVRTGRERGPLAPIFLRNWGKQSRRWPILPGPAAPQKRPQSFRLFLMMTSVTASNTNCTFLVSVAHVKCV